MTQPLRAEHAVGFSYQRSVGGATERFLRGLAAGEIWGSRCSDGRVVVPAVDHDPESGAPSEEFVRVGQTGVVRSWTWVATPAPEHPVPAPFAFALIQLDGADTALVHVIDTADETALATGMRVRADWRAARTGSIRDIRAFVPGEVAVPPAAVEPPDSVDVVSQVHLDYSYEPGLVLSGFLRGLGEGRIEGGRCPSCGLVYVPPRVGCPACGGTPMQPVPLGDRGVIISYTVIHVPFPGMTMELPFAWARIQLDGADVPFPHLLGDLDVAEIRVGQRVRAVWTAAEHRAPTWESIRYFAPETP